jgi:hypothetical protein
VRVRGSFWGVNYMTGWIFGIWVTVKEIGRLAKASEEHPEGSYGLVRDGGRAAKAALQETFQPIIDSAKTNWHRLKEAEALTEKKWMDVPEHPRYKWYRLIGGLSIGSIVPVVIVAVQLNHGEFVALVAPAAFLFGITMLFKSLKYSGRHEKVRVWKGTNERIEEWEWKKIVDNCFDDRTEQEKADTDLGYKTVVAVLLVALVALSVYFGVDHYRSTHPPQSRSVLEER